MAIKNQFLNKRNSINVFLLCFVLFNLLLLACSNESNEAGKYIRKERTDNKVMEQFIDSLIGEMTLEEKAGQMVQLACEHAGIITKADGNNPALVTFAKGWAVDTAELGNMIRTYHIGSWLQGRAVSAKEWCVFNTILQKVNMKNSRLKIPEVFGADLIHGASRITDATIFPHNINMGATFNKDLNNKAAWVTSVESAAYGFHWVFNPELDLGNNVEWCRFFETYGEDPYLCSVLGSSYVKNLQENKVHSPYKQAACARHYMGYSDPRSGKDRSPAEISNQKLHEFHRPSFEAAIDSGLMSVMICSGEINGIPVHASKYMLTTVLREQLGFKGVALSDWEDVEKLVTMHGTAPNLKEACYQTLIAGLDVSMALRDGLVFCKNVVELVKEGRITEDRVDLSVRRVLRMKYKLGLFSRPYPECSGFEIMEAPYHKKWALQCSEESIVLLKNENNTLPIKQESRILLAGDVIDRKSPLCGSWTYTQGGEIENHYPQDMLTLFQSFKSEFGESQVDTVGAGNLQQKAKKSDVIVLTVGSHTFTEERGVVADLKLADNQAKLLEVACGTGKPYVILIVGGSALVFDEKIIKNASALVWVGLPGEFGAPATTGILSGRVNPSGKMSFSYPAHLNLFAPYNYKPSQAWKLKPHHKLSLYPFGHGLSYSTFEYSNLTLSDTLISPGQTITASVNVKNSGSVEGKETLLWYVVDEYGSITRPVKELRSFDKVTIAPGETQTFRFVITPEKDLSYPDDQGNLILEDGSFVVQIGGHESRFWLESK